MLLDRIFLYVDYNNGGVEHSYSIDREEDVASAYINSEMFSCLS